ncbi:HAD family hydrolase [Robbsia sp. Bb-Pol-6]|uniref:HAD family hydrolase n=1 Tax=Robbsia betulipollinis TaxID=2981849 RepID=A0ABT3ZGX8_9BURK|nr:HAD family hydrolase [Robbsia betulipollinis]MCY0385779.1 HAD family hydrolase [Robbsia betulipollinis]
MSAGRPRAVAFDIIETVFPLEPLRVALSSWGLPAEALETWFATALRDAFALATVDDFAPFARVLKDALEHILAIHGLDVTDDRRSALFRQMAGLPCRPDAMQAFRLLHAQGVPIVALSNGAAETTRAMLTGAGLAACVHHVVSVDDVRLSKPRREVYWHAARVADVAPADLALVAVHPWDINGAKAAGLVTGYVSLGRPFSDVMRAPDVVGEGLRDVVHALLSLEPGSPAAGG